MESEEESDTSILDVPGDVPVSKPPTPQPTPVRSTTPNYVSRYNAKQYTSAKPARWIVLFVGQDGKLKMKEDSVLKTHYLPPLDDTDDKDAPPVRIAELAVISIAMDEVQVFRNDQLTPETEFSNSLAELNEKSTLYNKLRQRLEEKYQKHKAHVAAVTFVIGESIDAGRLPPSRNGWRMWKNGQLQQVQPSDTFDGTLYDAPNEQPKIAGFDYTKLDKPLLIRQTLQIERTTELPAVTRDYGKEFRFKPAFGTGSWRVKVRDPTVVAKEEAVEKTTETTEEELEKKDAETLQMGEQAYVEAKARDDEEKRRKEAKQRLDEERQKAAAKKKADEEAAEAERLRKEKEAEEKAKEEQAKKDAIEIPVYLEYANPIRVSAEKKLDEAKMETLRRKMQKDATGKFKFIVATNRQRVPNFADRGFGLNLRDFDPNEKAWSFYNQGFFIIFVSDPTVQETVEYNIAFLKREHQIDESRFLILSPRSVKDGSFDKALTQRRPQWVESLLAEASKEKPQSWTDWFKGFVPGMKAKISGRRNADWLKSNVISSSSTLVVAANERGDNEYVYTFTDSAGDPHDVTLWLTTHKLCVRCKTGFTDETNHHGVCHWHSVHPQYIARQREMKLRTLHDFLRDNRGKLNIPTAWPAQMKFSELYRLCPNSKMMQRIKEKMDVLEQRDPQLRELRHAHEKIDAEEQKSRPIGLFHSSLANLETLMHSANSNSRINSEDVVVRECSRLYARLLTQRSVSKCLKPQDFDPRDPVTQPLQFVFCDTQQRELTVSQMLIERKHEIHAAKFPELYDRTAPSPYQRQVPGTTVSPHWHHGQIRVEGRLIYACCGQQEPCYTGQHSMDDVQPDLHIQGASGVKQRGSDHVNLHTSTEKLMQEIDTAYRTNTLVSREHARALLAEFNRAHGGIRVPKNVKFNNKIDKAYRRLLRDPQNVALYDAFWTAVAAARGLSSNSGRWYRSRVEQLETVRFDGELHIQSNMTVIQQLESRAKRYRDDEPRFYRDFPVPPPAADDCTPMPVVVPLPVEPEPTPYSPLPSSKKLVPTDPTWHSDNLRALEGVRRWIGDLRQWQANRLKGEEMDTFTTGMTNLEQASKDLEIKLNALKTVMLAKPSEFATASAQYWDELQRFRSMFQTLSERWTKIYVPLLFGATNTDLLFNPGAGIRSSFSLDEEQRIQTNLPDEVLVRYQWLQKGAVVARRGLLDKQWQTTVDTAIKKYGSAIVGFYDVPDETLTDIEAYVKTKPPGQIWIYSAETEDERVKESTVQHYLTVRDFDNTVKEAARAFYGVPEYDLQFAPLPALPTPAPSKTKKTADMPKKSPESLRKKPPPPKETPKTTTLDIKRRSKELLDLIAKFDEIVAANAALLNETNQKISQLEEWSANYPFWEYAKPLGLGYEPEIRRAYDYDTKENFDNFLATFKTTVVKVIPKLTGIVNLLTPKLRNDIDVATEDTQIAKLSKTVNKHIETYFKALNKFRNKPVVIDFPRAIHSISIATYAIPFVVWFATDTDGSQDDLFSSRLIESLPSKITIQGEKRIVPVFPDWFVKREIPYGTNDPKWDWETQKASLKGAPVLFLGFANNQLAMARKIDAELPDRNIISVYRVDVDKERKWTVAEQAFQTTTGKKWRAITALPPVTSLKSLDEPALKLSMPNQPILFKIVPSPNAYLNSFNTRMASLLKPLPPATLTVISSRQKVDLAARAEHDRPK